MSPSGAEFIRQTKSQISEIDPSDVQPLLDEGVAIVDVRENEEVAQGKIPGAFHVPRGHLESRIEGSVPDRSQRVVLYCASGNRSALAAKTMVQDLGYDNVESMTGGYTLWKDRGYEVEVPRSYTPEQRQRYSRHFLLPEIGEAGQQKLLDAKVLGQRLRGERAAVARGAVEDDALRTIGHRALDPRLEMTARHVGGAGDLALGDLLVLADVDDGDALVEERLDVRRVDLGDLALGLADELGAGRAHGRENS